MIVNSSTVDKVASPLMAGRWSVLRLNGGPSSICCTWGRRLTISVCVRTHRGPFLVFLCSSFSTPLSSLLFHYSVLLLLLLYLFHCDVL